MEKIKSKSFLLFWSLLGLGAMIAIWFLPWRFQVNDDEIMMWLVSGAYTGTPEPYAVFIHPLLSRIFSVLYTLSPAVPWYPLTWFLVIYLGYLVFLKQVVTIERTFWSRLIWTLFLFGFFVHFLFFLQFTIVAAFAISAGLASRLVSSKEDVEMKWYKAYPADILILAGILIRQEVPMLLFAGVLFLNFLIIRDKRMYRLLIMPVLLFLLFSSISHFMVNQEFQKQNQLRSQVFDHPVLQLHKQDFKDSHLELYHFSNGLIEFQNDSGLANKLEQWKVLLDQERSRQFTFSATLTALYTFIEHEVYLITIVLIFIAYTVSWKYKSQLIILVFLSTVLVVLSPFYLIKVQIYIIVFLLYFLISLILPHPDFSKELTLKGGALVLVLGICFHFYSYTKSSENIPSGQKLKSQLESLKAAGIEEVVLIAAGEVYHELVFENPLPFRVLGWPTLLNSGETNDMKRAYLVDSATYSSNAVYFKDMEPQPSIGDQVLLISN
ncbi:hypothetical protein [Algoriphagus aquimarinus]|uniref:Glycosyltransferase RgtA/B/C/D-like domain-containing protein n=1 Tax=Algoriphagus aquimarinus TaxID=237018 RepID=A0A1I1CG85_9BACT|nr:hypothetical protein [Algoriphagus aquimarinus]SFB61477.1 hypothetical protein SAMN04489723_1353 [Algoriphagus aquimarinus]